MTIPLPPGLLRQPPLPPSLDVASGVHQTLGGGDARSPAKEAGHQDWDAWQRVFDRVDAEQQILEALEVRSVPNICSPLPDRSSVSWSQWMVRRDTAGLPSGARGCRMCEQGCGAVT